MRRPGKVSPSRAAKITGRHQNTVYNWCRKAVAGEPTKVNRVEKDSSNGYYWLDLKELERLKKA